MYCVAFWFSIHAVLERKTVLVFIELRYEDVSHRCDNNSEKRSTTYLLKSLYILITLPLTPSLLFHDPRNRLLHINDLYF